MTNMKLKFKLPHKLESLKTIGIQSTPLNIEKSKFKHPKRINNYIKSSLKNLPNIKRSTKKPIIIVNP